MSKRLARLEKKSEGKGVLTRIKETIRPPRPIKPRIDKAVRALEMQLQRLDQTGNRLGEREKAIFGKVVSSISKHDTAHATVFANELAEIRKMSKMILQSRLALEQVVLRLRTVRELGDVVVSLPPAVSVIQGIRTGIAGVTPEAEAELTNIGTMLNSMLVEASQSSDMTLDFGSANENAQKIMSEAAAVAEQQMKSRFPELSAVSGLMELQAIAYGGTESRPPRISAMAKPAVSQAKGQQQSEVEDQLADRIRDFAHTRYIQPMRQRGEKQVTIRASDVHDEMGLTSRMPAVCGALGTKRFEKMCNVRLINRQGLTQGANVYFTFELL